MSASGPSHEFFLGGHDLEMVTIRDLLTSLGHVVHDAKLAWGARASTYAKEIADCRAHGRIPVLIELADDLSLADAVAAGEVLLVDHHGDQAGVNVPTALEQVFRLLKLAPSEWTRHFDLVAANDRGHVSGMQALDPPASTEELLAIRAADRSAQGITPEEEAQGRTAAENAEQYCCGRLTVVRLVHRRVATVTDALDRTLGGPGFENLLILSPGQTLFFGTGRAIDLLKGTHPGGWWGGELPTRGYWGIARRLDEESTISRLEEAVSTKPASEIEVKAFHHTLLWPLIMRTGLGCSDNTIEPFIQAFENAGWQEVSDEDQSVHSDYIYDEVVYFHPFVRDLLFGDGSQSIQDRLLRRLRRDDLKSMQVAIQRNPDQPETRFETNLKVERAELLLIRPRIVLLLIEVSNRDPSSTSFQTPNLVDSRKSLTLDQVLYLQSRLRHVYPAFFHDNGRHGDCPAEVTWEGLTPSPEFTTTTPRETFDKFTRTGAEPPVYSHWIGLFNAPNQPPRVGCLQSADDLNREGLFFQQLIDDRMPSLSFIAVENPTEITQRDQDCLIDFNPPGLSYEESFQSRIRLRYRYDRFRHWNTTYYCNGTSFAMVCEYPTKDRERGHFSAILLSHFRRHYTHLAVLAHYQHSGLLFFSDALAEIAKEMEPTSTPDAIWREKLRRVQHRFLKFRTRSYFTQVSNQIQGKDLFRLWFDNLGTEELFQRVATTLSEVNESVENDEMKQLTQEQRHLSIVATWGLGISIGLASSALVFDWAGLFPEGARTGPLLRGSPVWGPWFWLMVAAIPAVPFVSWFVYLVKRK